VRAEIHFVLALLREIQGPGFTLFINAEAVKDDAEQKS
jgi:hypothetical protein